jgi:transcriptional regulator with XRE-family HTH domain
MKKLYAPRIKEALKEYENYPSRLVSLREALDPRNVNITSRLSQRMISEITGLLPQNYNKIEKGLKDGGSNLTIQQAITLATVYGCSVDYIVSGRENGLSLNQKVISDDAAGKIRILEGALESEKRAYEMQALEIKRLERELDLCKKRKK